VKPFWNGFLLSLSLCLDLGIVNVAVVRISLEQGGRAGFMLGVGSCVGDLVYFTLAVLGAAVLLDIAAIRWALWIVGTCALLYLTWRMAHHVIHPKALQVNETRPRSTGSGIKLLFSGLGLALASPSAILWFAAVGGSVIASLGGDRVNLWKFGMGFATAGLAWAAVFAYAVATLRLLGTRLVRGLSLASALLFLYLAIVVFVDGVRHFL
jgi:L-lysine exporter family protein LysE/ArgO